MVPRRLPILAVASVLVLAPLPAATQSGQSAVGTRAEAAPPATLLAPDLGTISEVPPELLARLRVDLFSYFRFVNKPWAQRVCEQFATELRSLPPVQLHGDAHLEQYAVTGTTRGLDDFDDSARGPSVIDLVRFLGSIEIAARARGWTPQLDHLFDEFFRGYRQGLQDPRFMPPEPAVVPRIRAAAARERPEFLAWADSLMVPLTAAESADVETSIALFATLVVKRRPDLAVEQFKLKKAGWLHMGVGSALNKKVLLRVEGPTPAPEDDVIIEGKQLSDLRGVACLEVPPAGEVFRVITGADQLGRIRHDFLAEVPRLSGRGPEVRDWYVRNWEATYAELRVADLRSVEELAEVVHDAGAQLGASNLMGTVPMLETHLRQAELDAMNRLEPRIRAVSHQLTDALIQGWEQLNK